MDNLEARMRTVSARLDAAMGPGEEAAFDAAWVDLLALVDERREAEAAAASYEVTLSKSDIELITLALRTAGEMWSQGGPEEEAHELHDALEEILEEMG